MPRLIAVFDTNIYRELSDDTLVDLMARERAVSVVASPCYQVVHELMAHLVPCDGEYNWCYAALARLGRHCRYFDGRRFMLSFQADGLDQVAVSLFGRPAGDPGIPEDLAGLIGHVVEGNVSRAPEAYESAFTEIARHVRATRKDFAAAIHSIEADLAINTFGVTDLGDVLAHPLARRRICDALEKDTMLDGPAGMIYRQVAEWLNLPSASLPPAAIAKIVDEFPTPLRFFNRVVKGCICDGWRIDGPKRLGVAHDVRISFLVSDHARIGGTPICLVTEDKLIHEAAASAGLAPRVLRRGDYEDLLSRPHDVREWPQSPIAAP
jgi:hypothetical protein